MEGLNRLVREKNLANYVARHNLSDAMEALIAGLIILRPADPCAWCVDSLARLEDMPGYSVSWDCLIPPEKRPSKNICDRLGELGEGYLDEIFRLGTIRHIPPPELFEKAYNHYYLKIKKKMWRVWYEFKQKQIKDRDKLMEQYETATIYHKNRQMRLILNKWIDFTKVRLVAADEAQKKLTNVWNSYYQHTVVSHWQTTVADAVLTRKYFEMLESDSGTLDVKELEYLGIDLYKDPISLLNHETSVKIFSHLNMRDLTTCSMVCRSWKLITSAPSLWSRLDFYRVRHRFSRYQSSIGPLIVKWRAYLIHLNLRCQFNVEPSTLKLIGGCKNLQDLNLSECNGVTDQVIKVIVEGCTGMLYLNISHTSVTDLGMKDVGRNCASLQNLSVRNCSRVSERGIHSLAIGKAGRKLTYFDMSYCSQVNLPGYHSIAKGMINLHTLVLNGNFPLNDGPVIVLVQKLTKLHTLKLKNCPNLKDTGMKYLAECKTLKTLELEENHHLSDQSIKVIAKYCPEITNLTLIDCERLTDVSMKNIAALPNLKKLDISDCIKVSDFGIRYLADGPSASGLKSLDLSNVCRISDLSVFRIAKSCQNLTSLSVAFCEHLTDAGIDPLDCMVHLRKLDLTGTRISDETLGKLGRLLSLSELIISECTEITGNGLSKFCTRIGKRLEYIDVSHCKALTDNPMKTLAYNCRKLKSINIAGCWRLKDATIYGIASSCSDIEMFDISGCYYMTDGVLKHFAKLKRLNLLIMKFCRNITSVGYHKISNSVPEVYYNYDDAPQWFGYSEIGCLATMAVGSIKPESEVASRKSTAKKKKRPGTGASGISGISDKSDKIFIGKNAKSSESENNSKQEITNTYTNTDMNTHGSTPKNNDKPANIDSDLDSDMEFDETPVRDHDNLELIEEEGAGNNAGRDMVTRSFSLMDGSLTNFTQAFGATPVSTRRSSTATLNRPMSESRISDSRNSGSRISGSRNSESRTSVRSGSVRSETNCSRSSFRSKSAK